MKIKHISLLIVTIIFSLNSSAQEYRVNRTNEKQKAKIKQQELGKNIVSFIPFKLVLSSANVDMYDYNPLSVGVAYERIFDNDLISFQLPITFSIDRFGIYATPGIKLYPKRQGLVKYAVGPQLLMTFVDGTYQKFIPTQNGGGYYQITDEMRKTFGFGINNSINFTIAKSFYLGLDATLGMDYYDSYSRAQKNNLNYYAGNNPMNIVFALGFNAGYRF